MAPELLEHRQEIQLKIYKNLSTHLNWMVKLPWLPVVSRFFAFVGLSTLIWASLGYLSSSLLPFSLQPPSTSVTLSAVLVTLIGTSFLSFYRSTMEEARGYVSEPQTIDDDQDRENWEAARRKIQYYMHENLRQVRWIFWLTLIAMFLGFVIIIYGARLQVAPPSQGAPPTQLATQIIVTLSGVIVEFIGATFLFIYKSTMAQANHYVSILERINNVWMAKLLLTQMKPAGGFSEETVARMASQILTLRGLEDIKEEPTRFPWGGGAAKQPGSDGPKS